MFENWYKCIPMYDDIERQHWTENDIIFKQPNFETYNNYLLPFQVIRGKNPSTAFTLELYDSSGVLYMDVTAALTTEQFTINTAGGSDIIQYIATEALSAIDCGAYYYYFTDGTNEWWSEIFLVRSVTKSVGVGMAIVDNVNLVVLIETPSMPLVPLLPAVKNPAIVEKS